MHILTYLFNEMSAANSTEEYYDAKEEFISDNKIVKFDITKNIIYK